LDPSTLQVLVVADQDVLRYAAPGNEHEAEARLAENLDRLEQLAPQDPTLKALRSDQLQRAGMEAVDGGDIQRAFDLFSQSAALSEVQFPARVMLGQVLWYRGEMDAAVEQLEDCERLWPEVAGPGLSSSWLFAARAWLVGAADRAGRPELAIGARDRAASMLGDPQIQPADAFTLAEFVAVSEDPELHDCALVERLLEDFRLEERFGETQGDLLEKIASSCPR
jgi:hypothetical protein